MKLVHMSSSFFDNAGDKYLSCSVKKIFENRFGKINWLEFDIRRLCSKNDIGLFNSYDGIIIGGGGLILPSSFYKKTETGWTLGIPSDLIRNINVPIIVYGIGYNLFRGEEISSDVFLDNISNLINRSSLFSMRHSGDVKKIKNLVQEDCGKKVSLNFCASLLGGSYQKSPSNNIAFQFAWDRLHSRFGSPDNVEKFIRNITEICRIVSVKDGKIFLVSHTNSDLKLNSEIYARWKEKGVTCELINLVNKECGFLVDFYHNVKTVFAMRGHSQMIPLGLGCNVVSLISHDKIKYLLDDLNIPETGVEINDEDFNNKCLRCYDLAQNIDFGSKLEIVKNNINKNLSYITHIVSSKG